MSSKRRAASLEIYLTPWLHLSYKDVRRSTNKAWGFDGIIRKDVSPTFHPVA